MRLISLLFPVFTAFLASSASADWMCEGSCDTSCFNGTLSRSGPYESSAREEMRLGCNQTAAEFGCAEAGTINARIDRCYNRGGTTPPPTTPKKFTVEFRNNCPKHGTIWAAVYYRDLGGNWLANGYWALNYGETASVATTTNRIFYTHAHAANNSVVWGDGTAKHAVHGEIRPFSKQTISQQHSGGTYPYKFNCN